MRRIQIHLDEDLDEALARQAHDKGISKAALIRDYLRLHVSKDVRGQERPSRLLIGAYEGSADESASIDDVVYGR